MSTAVKGTFRDFHFANLKLCSVGTIPLCLAASNFHSIFHFCPLGYYRCLHNVIQYLCFYDWLVSLNDVCKAHSRSSLYLPSMSLSGLNSISLHVHIMFVHLVIGILVIMNTISINSSVQTPGIPLSILRSTYLEVRWLHHTVVCFKNFQGLFYCFPKQVHHILIPSMLPRVLISLCLHWNLLFSLCDSGVCSGMVLICISLVTSTVEQLFLCASQLNNLEKCLSVFSFFNGVASFVVVNHIKIIAVE